MTLHLGCTLLGGCLMCDIIPFELGRLGLQDFLALRFNKNRIISSFEPIKSSFRNVYIPFSEATIFYITRLSRHLNM